MDDWKDSLNKAFEAPPPLRKQQFLQKLRYPEMRMYEFLLTQVGYIRKWVWGVSALIFTLSLIGTAPFGTDSLWCVSALTPMLALTLVSESGRSEFYEMAEMEQATRFSLRSVIMARLLILGIENLAVLLLLVPVSVWNQDMNPIRAGVYIITPYLLTAWTGLSIVRRYRGREAAWTCMGAAVCVAVSVLILHTSAPQIYGAEYLFWWVMSALALLVSTAKQGQAIFKRTEELSWSFS